MCLPDIYTKPINAEMNYEKTRIRRTDRKPAKYLKNMAAQGRGPGEGRGFEGQGQQFIILKLSSIFYAKRRKNLKF